MKWKVLVFTLVLVGISVVMLYFNSSDYEEVSPLVINELLENHTEMNVVEIFEIDLEEGIFRFRIEIKNNTEDDIFLGSSDFEFFDGNDWMIFSNASGDVIGRDRIASMETLNSHHGITGQILPRRATGLVRIRQTIWTTPYHTPGIEHDLVVEIDLSK